MGQEDVFISKFLLLPPNEQYAVAWRLDEFIQAGSEALDTLKDKVYSVIPFSAGYLQEKERRGATAAFKKKWAFMIDHPVEVRARMLIWTMNFEFLTNLDKRIRKTSTARPQRRVD
ncbi:hypothetical protein W97_05981 [Coniosporium apollinis CBS 100218]|uniref:Uncharacterized protein n=1 Tax=Coniosporium apollinis (strain CBS 100218) TaxID=1168221 RepID=R7YXR6_CONA1|nr:uncharacterized protein W97_05981 [Coniosporium apollinis CBS 100218]EON66735.1 hypothetical protein W97_05981 [Coniosporium apollinis CBS 100218]